MKAEVEKVAKRFGLKGNYKPPFESPGWWWFIIPGNKCYSIRAMPKEEIKDSVVSVRLFYCKKCDTIWDKLYGIINHYSRATMPFYGHPNKVCPDCA